MKITGFNSLQGKLSRLLNRGKKVIVRVGYTQQYAIFVHENLQAHHTVGQAKYLEQPARQLESKASGMVAEVMQKGKDLATGVLLVGLRLQRESQQLVPVDTGALKGSAFTRKEK